MALTIGKENVGAQREFSTTSGLERAIAKAGAYDSIVDLERGQVRVVWQRGEQAEVYAIAADGRVDAQLAWDME